MSGAKKRYDSKGVLLQTGESQRSDGSYQFRYKDNKNKWQYTYAPTLKQLREKEVAIKRDIEDGINIYDGKRLVIKQIEGYLSRKKNLTPSTIDTYNSMLSAIRDEPLMQMQIKDVKYSNIKDFYIKKHNDGFKRNTLLSLNNILHPAFQEAVDDDILRKNPVIMGKILKDIPEDAEKRQALTEDQEQRFFTFAKEQNFKYLDIMIILVETGLRISELCGLTKNDLDFENRTLTVNKQLSTITGQGMHITPPKSASGNRIVPLSSRAIDTFKHVLDNRLCVPVEKMIDGYCGFIFLSRYGNPLSSGYIKNKINDLETAYKAKYQDDMPSISAHVFRHTFSTRQMQKGLDMRSLSGIMGHSDFDTTLIYTHYDSDFAIKSFQAVNK